MTIEKSQTWIASKLTAFLPFRFSMVIERHDGILMGSHLGRKDIKVHYDDSVGIDRGRHCQIVFRRGSNSAVLRPKL